MILTPLARNAEEAIGSMGNDLALAVLSDQRPLLYSLLQAALRAGHEPADRLDPRGDRDERRDERRLGAQPARRVARACAPARDRGSRSCANAELESLRQVDSDDLQGAHDRHHLAGRRRRGRARRARSTRICREADEALADGVNIVILSDRSVGADRAPIPALLAVSSVHHHLVREGTRLQAGLVIESGEPRDVHHFATLIGYGAAAINPYVMLESLAELVERGLAARGDDAPRRRRSARSRGSPRGC